MSWDTTLAALQAWVASGSGVAATNVRWSGQGGTRPSVVWISLGIINESVPGPDWVFTEDAAVPVSGAEISYKVRGCRTGTLSIQCFAGSAVGSSSPFAILRKLHASARLPTTKAAMLAAGIGLGTMGTVQDTPAIVNTTNFEPRATMTIEFFTANELIETGTYIETVEVTGTVTE
jgi:hypothetical protein